MLQNRFGSTDRHSASYLSAHRLLVNSSRVRSQRGGLLLFKIESSLKHTGARLSSRRGVRRNDFLSGTSAAPTNAGVASGYSNWSAQRHGMCFKTGNQGNRPQQKPQGLNKCLNTICCSIPQKKSPRCLFTHLNTGRFLWVTQVDGNSGILFGRTSRAF